MNYMPFNSISGDRVYKAEDWAFYFSKFIGNGVFAPSTGHPAFEVYADGGMNLDVWTGVAFINGYMFNSNGAALTLDAAHPSLPRIDRVVIRWDLNNRLMTIALRKGTAASSPSAPLLTRSSTIYELAIADVYVDAGTTTIAQQKITDTRYDDGLCGIVTGVLNQVDWDSLTLQLRGFMTDFQSDLETYIATLHGILDTQTASHLLNLIQTLESEVDDHYGSGAGAANSHVYKDEITTITADMWSAIAAGTFDGIHVGMHYTAPSGRSYYFADADYFYRHRIRSGGSWQTMTDHHMLVIEDEINHTAQASTADNTAGGYAYSNIKTTLYNYLSELETDFGASHILTAYFTVPLYRVSSDPPTVYDLSGKSFLLNTAMIYGNHPLTIPPYPSGTEAWESFYESNRSRQLSLFRGLPDAVVAPYNGNDYSQYWLDDVTSTTTFGTIEYCRPKSANLNETLGVRRAFIIG